MIFDGQYLTYAEYQSLGGTLPEVPFNALELTARGIINERTLNRLKDLPEQINEVKVCVFQLINSLVKSAEICGLSSENIDGYSVTYAAKPTKEQEELYNDIVRDNLLMCRLEDGTPYMYCGVD